MLCSTLRNSELRLFFVHSPMQLAIVAKIARPNDTLVVHRGLKVSNVDLRIKSILYYEEFSLTGMKNIHSLLKLISHGNFTEIIFPHSLMNNKLFPFIYLLEPSIKITYIEDGALTWRYLNSKNRNFQSPKKLHIIKLVLFRFSLIISLSLPIVISTKCLKVILRFLQTYVPRGSYIFRDDTIGKIFTSFNVGRRNNNFVNVLPENKKLDQNLASHSAFFLSPRYLLTDQDKLSMLLREKIGDNILLLIVHPTFWKQDKGLLLQDFLKKMEKNSISYKIFERECYDLDVTFELYLRGCPHFIFIDTSSEITVNTNKQFFSGLRVCNIQYEVYGKATMLTELGIKKSHYQIGKSR